jgi:hypothetical protein
LLGNGAAKHVSKVTNTLVTIKAQQKAVFPVWSVPHSKHINGLKTNRNLVMGLERARNQERLCWRSQQQFTAMLYYVLQSAVSTHYLAVSRQSQLVIRRENRRRISIVRSAIKRRLVKIEQTE